MNGDERSRYGVLHVIGPYTQVRTSAGADASGINEWVIAEYQIELRNLSLHAASAIAGGGLSHFQS
jgi:hypothetical protein